MSWRDLITIKEVLSSPKLNSEYTLRGWIKTHRRSKNAAFIEVGDGTTVKGLQVVIDPSLRDYSEIENKLTTGTAILCKGVLVESPAKGQDVELKCTNIQIIGECPADEYPLQKKGHSFEFLRQIAHLRPRTNSLGAVFRVRSHAAMAVHKFFQDNGFFYVTTPIITTSDCEGAGEMFLVTTLDLEKVPRSEGGEVDFSKDFFKSKAGLTVSGQLEAEIFATALSRVYTFGPTFRAENSNTARHLAEFWMIEPEMAFFELEQNMDLAEDFVKYIIKYVLEHCEEEMKLFDKWIENGLIDAVTTVADAQFERITYTEAIRILESANRDFEYPVKWGMDLQTEHERYLCEQYFKKPVFVIDYPKEIKAFYMRLNEDGRTVRAMDLLVPRVGELIGGSQREERYDVLLKKIRDMGLDEENLWWYLELRRFGSVPHSGFGLGFERFILYITGMKNIRDVIPCPRHPGNADF